SARKYAPASTQTQFPGSRARGSQPGPPAPGRRAEQPRQGDAAAAEQGRQRVMLAADQPQVDTGVVAPGYPRPEQAEGHRQQPPKDIHGAHEPPPRGLTTQLSSGRRLSELQTPRNQHGGGRLLQRPVRRYAARPKNKAARR